MKTDCNKILVILAERYEDNTKHLNSSGLKILICLIKKLPDNFFLKINEMDEDRKLKRQQEVNRDDTIDAAYKHIQQNALKLRDTVSDTNSRTLQYTLQNTFSENMGR